VRSSPLAALPFLASFPIAPILVISAAERGLWTFLPILVVFVAVPILDAMGGTTEEARVPPDLDHNLWFKAVTWAWVPVQLATLAWVLATVSSSRLTTLELVGVTLSMGVVSGGVGITFAHELVHRRQPFERALGEILLASVSYTHFAIEHVHGHHRHVGTPDDPATARFGESFYRFLPRTVVGSVVSAWRIELGRLSRRAGGAFSPSNRMLRYALTQIALYPLVAFTFGRTGLAVFAGQAAVAISLLEVINYVEHYGLMRRQIGPGEYERIAPRHSWDSSYKLTNWMLINLARHSDHHCAAAKRYQSLELPGEAPQLPAGYSAMLLLALVPPLWFRVMNPRALAAAK
jgi:alkane 1-monooxygenase